MSAYREGNIIDLGFAQLQVVDACSGLRYLYPLIVMGLLLSYFYKAAFWKKIILVISTVPITIVTNSLRIALTGILYEAWGPEVAEGFFHGFSGWFIFMLGLGVLLLEMWVMNGFKQLFRSKKAQLATLVESLGKEPSETIFNRVGRPELSSTEEETTRKINDQNNWLRELLSPPQFVAAVVLLGLTLVLSQGVEFREKIPISKSFDKFPLEVAEWNGNRESMEQKFLGALHLNDYVIVDYMNGDRKQVNFYTAYYETQRKGKSIHSPASCMPGSGWEFRKAGRKNIPVQYNGGDSMPVNRAYMVKGEQRQLSYYWFPQRDRILTNAYQLKLYNFWDALTRQRTDGALVRLITPVYEDEELVNAEERLIAFTRDIVPVLDEFLPK
jgi:exosortase D (VPLPA-CTERM-specific)